MRKRNYISEASAEMLLNFLYPEVEKQWIAHGEGSFYRNYNSDLLDFDDETKEIWTARDTFLNLLPQGVINQDKGIVLFSPNLPCTRAQVVTFLYRSVA